MSEILQTLRNLIWLGRSRSNFAEYPVDETFYLTTYPDVAQSGISASDHFKKFGCRELRNPSRSFNTAYYILVHMSGNFLNDPLLDFVKAYAGGNHCAPSPQSQKEWITLQKRHVEPFFDTEFYVSKYAEALSGRDPIDHYFQVGWLDGFNPRSDFSTRGHLEQNFHVINSNLNPFFHYIMTSKSVASNRSNTGDAPRHSTDGIDPRLLRRSELIRVIGEGFDPEFYLNEYVDIRRAGVNPLLHYVDYGSKEGRKPTDYFWPSYYIKMHPEVTEMGVDPFFHYIKVGLERGYKPNPMGAQTWPAPSAPAETDWRALQSVAIAPSADVVIIMPVYRGYDDTLAAIYSVLTNPQESKFELLVIFDCGPEADLKVALRQLSELKLFSYYENECNLGFIGTVNRGLDLRPDKDVILLNADTIVYNDWIDRILSHARASTDVATITPFSNNATICSYPSPHAK